MMIRALCVAILIVFSISSLSFGGETGTSSSLMNEYLSTNVEIKRPEQASLVGEYFSNTDQLKESLFRGTFGLSMPLSFPSNRAPFLYPITPSYSPTNGLSEFGLGWSFNLSIYRYRKIGEVTFNDQDEFNGMLGHLIRANDGKFYKESAPQQLVLEQQEQDLIAYLENGQKLVFSAANSIVNSKQEIYAWYLRSVSDVYGHFVSFQYEKNESGRPYLKTIEYGTKNNLTQYRIVFYYEKLAKEQFFVDYRSGSKIISDQRVKSILIKIKDSLNNWKNFQEYDFKYLDNPLKTAFYLVSLQKSYYSYGRIRSSEPEITYNYAMPDPSKLVLKDWKRLDLFSNFMKKFMGGGRLLIPSRSSFVDFDEDGIPEFDFSINHKIYYQKDGQIFDEGHEAPPNTPNSKIRDRCIEKDVVRLYSRIYGADTPYVILDFAKHPQDLDTDLFTCNQEGLVLGKVSLQGGWKPGPEYPVRLADLGHKGSPDLILFLNEKIRILKNLSTKNSLSFSDRPIELKLEDYSRVDSTWLQDLNGDGVLDIIAKYKNQLLVWYGKGNYSFETTATRIPVLNREGEKVTNLHEYQMYFIDIDGDGLVDMFLFNKNKLYLYINHGTYFKEISVPALNSLKNLSNIHPSFNDLRGTGNITTNIYVDEDEVMSLEFNRPESGLLISANDGKGNLVTYDYERLRPSKGVVSLRTVLKAIHIQTSGETEKTISLSYEGPVLDPLSKVFYGFKKVTSIVGPEKTESFYHHDDKQQGLLLKQIKTHTAYPHLANIIANQFEEFDIHGLHIKRIINTQKGWQSLSQNDLKVILEQNYKYEDRAPYCLQEESLSSSTGELVKSFHYDTEIEKLKNYPTCLKDKVEVLAHHKKHSDWDFHYILSLDRNNFGDIEKLKQEDYQSKKVRLIEELSYDKEFGQRLSLYSPKKGLTFYAYNEIGQLISILTGDGVLTKIESFDESSDAISFLSINKGKQEKNHEQHFSYDNFFRLNKDFDNGTKTSFENPLHEYSYQWASTEQLAMQTSSLEKVKTYVLLSAGGNELAKIAENEDFIINNLTKIDSDAGKISVRTPFALSTSQKESLGHSKTIFDNFTEDNILKQTLTSSEGIKITDDSSFHQNIKKESKTALNIIDENLVFQEIENDILKQEKNQNDLNKIISIKYFLDGNLSKKYSFEYDLAGNIRLIQLPSSTQQKISYNNFGDIALISHPGLASVVHEFDDQSGLLKEKKYLDSKGKFERSISYEYDKNARVIKTNYSNNRNEQKQIHQKFDGEKANGTKTEGQNSSLTSIITKDFTKEFIYKKNGDLKHSLLDLIASYKLQTSYQYYNDGTHHYRHYQVLNKLSQPLFSTKLEYKRDTFNRPFQLYVDGNLIYTLSYNKLGHIHTILFADESSIQFEYDTHTHIKIGHKRFSKEGKLLNQSLHQFNNNGFIANEEYQFSDASHLKRDYTYNKDSSLKSSSDEKYSYVYKYDLDGFMFEWNDKDQKYSLKTEGSQWTSEKDIYDLDDSGRVKRKNSFNLSYGADGKIASMISPQKSYEFIYDENGFPLICKKNKEFDKAYIPFEDDQSLNIMITADGELIIPVVLAKQYIGNLTNGHFEHMFSDDRKTEITEEGSLKSPYGIQENSKSKSKYTGKVYLEDINLYVMGQRFYDPIIGRFISPDPFFFENPEKCLGSPIECNLYSYAGNNPIKNLDPTGLRGQDSFNDELAISFGAQGISQGWDKSMSLLSESAKGAWDGLTTFAKGYAGTALGLTTAPAVVAAAPSTISTVALKMTIEANIAAVSLGMYAAKNPEKVENIVGAGISFIQGITAGITNVTSPDYDGSHCPGNDGINLIVGKVAEYVGNKVRENYVER